jgi:hypothetical protein
MSHTRTHMLHTRTHTHTHTHTHTPLTHTHTHTHTHHTHTHTHTHIHTHTTHTHTHARAPARVAPSPPTTHARHVAPHRADTFFEEMEKRAEDEPDEEIVEYDEDGCVVSIRRRYTAAPLDAVSQLFRSMPLPSCSARCHCPAAPLDAVAQLLLLTPLSNCSPDVALSLNSFALVTLESACDGCIVCSRTVHSLIKRASSTQQQPSLTRQFTCDHFLLCARR